MAIHCEKSIKRLLDKQFKYSAPVTSTTSKSSKININLFIFREIRS
jgi:hypothetical protein